MRVTRKGKWNRELGISLECQNQGCGCCFEFEPEDSEKLVRTPQQTFNVACPECSSPVFVDADELGGRERTEAANRAEEAARPRGNDYTATPGQSFQEH